MLKPVSGTDMTEGHLRHSLRPGDMWQDQYLVVSVVGDEAKVIQDGVVETLEFITFVGRTTGEVVLFLFGVAVIVGWFRFIVMGYR